MWSSIIMQENNFVMPGVVVDAFCLECSAQSQLCSVESPSNDLVRFEQLIIHDIKLIPPNTQHEFFFMNIRLGGRCWSMARWSSWFPLLWVIFHHSDYTIQKTLSFMPGKQHFTCEKSTFNVSRLQFILNPIPLFLNRSQWFQTTNFKREIVCWVTSNVSASSFCVWHESSSNNASNSTYTFGLPLRSLSSTSNSPFLNFWNHSRQLLSLKAASPYASTSNLWASAADFFKLRK